MTDTNLTIFIAAFTIYLSAVALKSKVSDIKMLYVDKYHERISEYKIENAHFLLRQNGIVVVASRL